MYAYLRGSTRLSAKTMRRMLHVARSPLALFAILPGKQSCRRVTRILHPRVWSGMPISTHQPVISRWG